jgi:hypothetical protein
MSRCFFDRLGHVLFASYPPKCVILRVRDYLRNFEWNKVRKFIIIIYLAGYMGEITVFGFAEAEKCAENLLCLG